MKKIFPLIIILFSVDLSSAQNINFRDTNGLKALLSSKTWIRFEINADSTYSDRIMDSMRFYPNGEFYKSARPKGDSTDWYFPAKIMTGKWAIGATGKISPKDSAANCINVEADCPVGKDVTMDELLVLVDGHRIKSTKILKIKSRLDGPYIVCRAIESGIFWNKRDIWQPNRQFQKIERHLNNQKR